ncbi:MAG: putative rane protein, partial [Ramlibacter sp.]|nr:putative rane protein [Ramlibacter sp.]
MISDSDNSVVPTPAPVDPRDPPRVLLHMPVDIRSMSLVVLTVLAILAALRWASAFFIPLMVGLVFSYALSPVVEWLAHRKVPRALSAAVLILGILGGMGAAVYSFADDTNDLITSLPQAARKLRDSLHRARAPTRSDSTIDSVQKAAAELQRAADEAGGSAPASSPGGPAHVIVEKARFDLRDHLWSGTLGLATAVGQIVMVTFLTYFMLISGDTFRRKLVKITGPGFAEKKLTVQALEEINTQMQRYLLVQLLAGVGTGVATGIAFALIGLNHAAVWGIAAGVLSLVPYIGSTVVTVLSALVAFMQFGDVRSAVLVGGSSLVIDTIKGYVVLPWATSKASSMNAVAVFIGVLAWGWLWGVWGLLLGVPILMA